MRLVNMLKPAMLLVLMMVIVPMLIPAGASAAPTTISADLGRCRANVDGYRVQLQSGNQRAPESAFPASITLHFEDGSTAEATGLLPASFGTKNYSLDGVRDVGLIEATALFDVDAYPNYRFTVTARPCVEPTVPAMHTVSGDVVQRGNEKPVAELTVCLTELDECTATDASGSFSMSGVEDGTYTLTTNGSNWKSQSTTVTVSGGDVYVDIVQNKGGGN